MAWQAYILHLIFRSGHPSIDSTLWRVLLCTPQFLHRKLRQDLPSPLSTSLAPKPRWLIEMAAMVCPAALEALA